MGTIVRVGYKAPSVAETDDTFEVSPLVLDFNRTSEAFEILDDLEPDPVAWEKLFGKQGSK
jgi:hypothetical protein